MRRLNLKAMYNDPSQMREALAWTLVRTRRACRRPATPTPSSASTTATSASSRLIEQVDKPFLQEHFGANDRGQPLQGLLRRHRLRHPRASRGRRRRRQWSPVHRARIPTTGPTGSSRTRTSRPRTPTTTWPASSGSSTAAACPATTTFGASTPTPSAPPSMQIFNSRAFLRWAGVNLLLGSWDNYFATPANYYLYNSGRRRRQASSSSPISRSSRGTTTTASASTTSATAWQYTDIARLAEQHEAVLGERRRARPCRIPLVPNLLRNPEFRRYYLDHLDYLLDTLHPRRHRRPHARRGGGLWAASPRRLPGVATPNGSPFTGRQFSNDEVYRRARAVRAPPRRRPHGGHRPLRSHAPR